MIVMRLLADQSEGGGSLRSRLEVRGMRHIAKVLIAIGVIAFFAGPASGVEISPADLERFKRYAEEEKDKIIRIQVALKCLGYYFGPINAESKKQKKITIVAFKLWQRETGYRRYEPISEERLAILEAQAYRKAKGKCEIKG